MSFFSKKMFLKQVLCTVCLTAYMAFFPLNKGLAQSTTIELWDFPRWTEELDKTDRFVWAKRKIAEFEKLNPQIKVKFTKLTWKRGAEKLKIAAIGGNYPDVAAGAIPLLFINENLIEPINDYLTDFDKQDYFPGALDAFKIGEKIYGWPWYMSGQLLFANTSICASAGVELPESGRWTHEEFTRSLEKIKNYMDTGIPVSQSSNSLSHGMEPKYEPLTPKGAYPFGVYFQKGETANFPFLLNFGGRWISKDNKFAGTSPEIKAAFVWLKSLIEKGLAPSDSGGRKDKDIWTAFGKEQRIAIAAFGLWGIKALKQSKIDFQVMHYPQKPGKTGGPFIGTSGFFVFKKENNSKKDAAMKLAKFLTLAESQKELVKYSQFPTRKSAGNIYEGDPHMSKALNILSEGRTVFSDTRWDKIDEEIEASIQEILLNRKTIETGMSKTGDRINGFLANKSGSIRDDIRKGSIVGRIFLILFLASIIFALYSRQIHLFMVIPAIVIIGLFLFYPLTDALVLAFRNYRIGEVGSYTLENFIRAIEDPRFVKACKNTLLYTLVVVPANVFTALVVASLIYSLSGKMKSFFRAAYYLPGVASVVVLSMIWRWIFNTEVGLFNTVLRYLHMQPVGWLTNPDIAFNSIILAGILKSPGGAMLIYLASLGNIPKSLYESADLDGANAVQKWWNITVPLLRGTTAFLIITGTIASLQVFAQVLMLTDGGPGISTEVVVYRIYTSAFRDFDFGLSSAMALMLFFVILVVTIIQKKVTNKDVEYLA